MCHVQYVRLTESSLLVALSQTSQPAKTNFRGRWLYCRPPPHTHTHTQLQNMYIQRHFFFYTHYERIQCILYFFIWTLCHGAADIKLNRTYGWTGEPRKRIVSTKWDQSGRVLLQSLTKSVSDSLHFSRVGLPSEMTIELSDTRKKRIYICIYILGILYIIWGPIKCGRLQELTGELECLLSLVSVEKDNTTNY